MSDLRELYQSVILDHNKKPRNFGEPPGSNRSAQGHNPLCGDHVTVYLAVVDGVIEDVGFEGRGCAISTASASLMTEAIKGRSLEEAEKIFEGFHALVTGPAVSAVDARALGKLTVFAGVREFPMRVKCATLSWRALEAILQRLASTEDAE